MNRLNQYLEKTNYTEAPEPGEFRFDVRQDNVEDDWEIKTPDGRRTIQAKKGAKIALLPGTYIISKIETPQSKEAEKLRQREIFKKEQEHRGNRY